MSDENADFEKTEMFATVGWFESYVEETMKKQHVPFGVGKYAEDRKIYRSLPLFGGRSVHLGVDLWAPVGSIVHAPWDGIIHSFHDNNHKGDYGPTIILEHPDLHVFTLYGHLSRESLEGKEKGQVS
jgi:peptidoglycan LD-endopeptidase LytH